MSTFLASIQILKKAYADLVGEILLDGQPAYDETNDVLRIGDGSTTFVDLPIFKAERYKVISGLITQNGNNAPTAIILENTTGVTPTFSFIDIDVYGINATGLFTVDKTWLMINEGRAQFIRNSADQLRILVLEDTLQKTSFEIRIYE